MGPFGNAPHDARRDLRLHRTTGSRRGDAGPPGALAGKPLAGGWPPLARGHRPFVKMHGLGNHFVVVDARRGAARFERDDIVRICDTHVGVGGEQLLTIGLPSEAGRRAGAVARLRIFNIDGREVDACGNATRCVALMLFEETGRTALTIETGSGLLPCRRTGPDRVSVTYGPIGTDWRAVPLARAVDTLHLPIASGVLRDGVALHVGVPHAVFFVPALDDVAMASLAPAIQEDPLFPEGVNVGAAQIVDATTIRLVVWERPGILTTACGTGACAVAWAARLRGLTAASRITVLAPAGALDVTIDEGGTAELTGPAAYCCHGFV